MGTRDKDKGTPRHNAQIERTLVSNSYKTEMAKRLENENDKGVGLHTLIN